MDLLADTSFLIDLWREQERPGPATRFAHGHADYAVGVSWVVAGEFMCGSVLAGHDAATMAAFLERYPVAHSDTATVLAYAATYAALRRKNTMVGPNDLWIASAALSRKLPLLTRNAAEFSRVPDLLVVDYRKDR
jgi:tRNA(fMet)-specific endonuclease VapC